MPCPGEEDLKYRLTRVSIDCIDLYLVESGAALNIQVYFNGYFLDFFFCNKTNDRDQYRDGTSSTMQAVVEFKFWIVSIFFSTRAGSHALNGRVYKNDTTRNSCRILILTPGVSHSSVNL